jgi:hypothetical protein
VVERVFEYEKTDRGDLSWMEGRERKGEDRDGLGEY